MPTEYSRGVVYFTHHRICKLQIQSYFASSTTKVQVLARRVFIGVLEYMDDLLTFYRFTCYSTRVQCVPLHLFSVLAALYQCMWVNNTSSNILSGIFSRIFWASLGFTVVCFPCDLDTSYLLLYKQTGQQLLLSPSSTSIFSSDPYSEY
jgi:hypothetical protein